MLRLLRWTATFILLLVMTACNLPMLSQAGPPASSTLEPVLPAASATTSLTPEPALSSTPSLTPTASLTPSPTPTETPSVPTFTLVQNANCRRGPSQVYDVLTSLLAGQAVPIVAQNEDGTWWLVRIPSKEICWISGVTGLAGGAVTALPVATGQPGCNVLDASLNPVCTIPCPKKNPKPADICTP